MPKGGFYFDEIIESECKVVNVFPLLIYNEGVQDNEKLALQRSVQKRFIDRH